MSFSLRAAFLRSVPLLDGVGLYKIGLADAIVFNGIVSKEQLRHIEERAATDRGQVTLVFDAVMADEKRWSDLLQLLHILGYKELAKTLSDNTESSFSNTTVQQLGSLPILRSVAFMNQPDDEANLHLLFHHLFRKASALVIYGEMGVGKTSLLSKLVSNEQHLLLKCHGISTLIWMNVAHIISDKKLSMFDFGRELLKLLKLPAPEAEDDIVVAIKSFFENCLPNRCLIVFDEINDRNPVFSHFVNLIRDISDNVATIIIAKSRQDVSIKLCIHYKIKPWSLGQLNLHISDGEDDAFEVPAELLQSCHGLPLCSTILKEILRRSMPIDHHEPHAQRLYLDLVDKTSQSAKDNHNFITHLLQSQHFTTTQDLLEIFLIFEGGGALTMQDLTVLWEFSSPTQAVAKCRELTMYGFLLQLSTYQFVLHPLMYSYLKLNLLSRGEIIDEFRVKKLTACCIGNENVLELAIQYGAQALHEAIFKICNAEIIFQLSNSSKALVMLAEKCSFKALAKVLDKMLEHDLSSSIETLKNMQSVHAKIFDSALTSGLQTIENIFLVSIFEKHSYLREYFLLSAHIHEKLSEVVSANGYNAVMLATEIDDLPTVKRLLGISHFRIKLDLAKTKKDGYTALHLAAKYGRETIIPELLHASPNKLCPDNEGNIPLSLAVKFNHSKVSHQLLDMASVESRNYVGECPLWFAFINGNVEVVTRILEMNNAQLVPGERMILYMRSLFHKKQKASDLLTTFYPELRRSFSNVQLSVSEVRAPLIRLLAKSVNLDHLEDFVFAAVINDQAEVLFANMIPDFDCIAACVRIASFLGRSSVLKGLLIKLASQPNSDENFKTDEDGNSPLYIASSCGHVEIAKILIADGAAVNKINKKGRTALMVASANGHGDVVKLLIESNANILLRDNSGTSAFYVACSNGHISVVKLLFENAGRACLTTARKWNGFSALMAASRQGHDEIVKFLIANGGSLDETTHGGYNALSVALWRQRDSTIRAISTTARSDVKKTVKCCHLI